MLWAKLLACQCVLIAAQGPGPGRKKSLGSTQMQSRAVDTRIQLEVQEGQPRGTIVGKIPTRTNFTYRFNEPPEEFSLDAATGTIRTTMVLDRESFRSDRFDLVVLSSQPTYPIEVRIVVTDVNDNAPQFPEPSISVTFSESAAAETRLLLDSATDRDSGRNGVSDDYKIIDGNKDDKFRLVVTSNPSGETSYLHLETTGKLDRETRGFYNLNISARDGGNPPLFGYLQVNVTVLDVNDNPPMFDHSDYTVSLNESVPPGTRVLQVMATDNDIGDNAEVTYYLEDISRQFTIDPETGVISTLEFLKCVQQQNCSELKSQGRCPKSCVISVSAWDHGSPRQVGRAYVTVNLVEVNTNDHDPIINFTYFLRPAKFATVDENAANGSVVAAVTVVDLDEGTNGETSVIIAAGNEMNHFRLDSTPAVRVNAVLDREEISKYNLTIVATDMGSPPRSSSASLIIYVNDVNDHDPVFEKSEYTAVLSELSPAGTYVAGTTATDADTGVNAQIYYAFVSGNERNWFELNPESGLITTQTAIDREVQGTVELKISAHDGGPNPKWAYTQLKVTILDENDEKPFFAQDVINVTLSESSPPNSLIAMLTATDYDQGTNGSVVYSLLPDPFTKLEETFALDELTGQLTTKSYLDRERVSNYAVRVVAKDQGAPPQSSTALVYVTVSDINDNAPFFYPVKYFSYIRDNLPNHSFLLQVFAHDKDEGKNAELRYSITNGNDGLFQIDERTGMISSKQSAAIKSLYRLTIGVRDLGGRYAEEEAVVEFVKENFREELEFEAYNGYEFKVTEDYDWKPANLGLEVGKIRIRKNLIENINYFITFGDPEKVFRIDEHSGVISTAKKIDRELKKFYSLTCIARGKLTFGQTTVNITVSDVNDNKPVFPKSKVFLAFAENAPVGQEVYHARARDLDAGINSRVKYNLSVNPGDFFRINSDTGVVYINRPIQKEPESSFQIEITATDFGDPPLFSKQTIIFTIEDVNDHTPMFDHTSYETSLLESTPVNDRFFRLLASDADLAKNAQISFSIFEGNSEGKFGVFPDGFMYLKSPLDRETKDYYALVLMARDHGIPPRSSTVPLVIHVIDENDNSPQFSNATFVFHIPENELPDTFVGKLTALDCDIGRNAELTFSFANAQGDFVIDPKNGFIKSLVVFDREALVEKTGKNFIELEAIVNDNGINRLKDKGLVVVYIDDVNDNPPVFLKTPYKVQISESLEIGSPILKVSTSDADEGINGDVFYAITAGNLDKKFGIDPATGQIVLKKPVDREENSRFVVTITAYDGAPNHPLSATTTIVIDILDENDNAPEFVQSETKITVPETSPIGAKLTQFRATDSDLGINSEISFSIESGNRRDTFQVDPTSGTLFLHKNLDFEDVSQYQLTIVASDGGNPRLSATALFTVSVEDRNDNPPAFPNTAIVRQIREDIPVNTPIVTVTAEDPDSGDNGKVSYYILNQEPESAQHERHFGINPHTGVIHTLLPIDRELIDTFRLTVVAVDQPVDGSRQLSAEKLVTVIVEDINDNAPNFVSMNAAALPVAENALIMQLFARDLDSNTNGLVTYDLVGGSTDLFQLHRTTGALTLKRSLINYDLQYKLVVKATDEAVQSERKSAESYITLFAANDLDGPVFEKGQSFGSVYENEPPGKSIVTVCANLPSHSIEYFVTNITANGVQVDRLFDIDTRSGLLSTAVALDRETGANYEVEVYAVSGNTSTPHTAKTKVIVSVLDKNDSPPSFKDQPLEFSVLEDLAPGQLVATLKAVDPDTIGLLKYQLLSGSDGRFTLDPTTGALRLNDSLDRETRDSYKLLVWAHDGQQYTEATIKITVTDTNDNPPLFTESVYSFDVAENTPRGTRVGEVTATDDDEGINGQVSYQVISDWANDVFSLNSLTGIFTLTSRLDYEDVQHYIFVVQAQDMGKPSLSSTLTVYFNVVDLNDNAPIFDPMSYSDEIFENVTIGTSVVRVSATDMDSGANGLIEYSLTAGDEEDAFEISSNGTISTKKSLDRETKSLYNLVVTATDMAQKPQPRLSSTVQVTIVLKDVNDYAAEFITPNVTTVAENTPINTVVLAVKAIDRDEGRNSYIEYSLGSESNGPFSLGPVDGLLRVTARLDRELRANYTLEIIARDRGDPPLASRQTVFINILDDNDNSPSFDPKQYSASVPENASIGASVLQVSATDIDDGPNGRVRYLIIAGDENRDFSISEDTGVVRVAKNLNYERKSRYVITVQAEDNAITDPVRYDTATISISVGDINDNPPTFLDSPYLAYVMENVVPPPHGYVLTVVAYDADTLPYNGQVRYFLKEGDAGLFKINASSGKIVLLRPLDREVQAEYILTLHAMDTGTPPLTGTGTVKIIVQDVNDHSPQFARQSFSADVYENSPIGTTILQASATDPDDGLNAQIRYSLLGEGVDRFHIDENTGVITTAALLDREDVETYFLTLVAQDSSPTEPRATAVNLTIAILDINDNPPRFESERFTVYIREGTKSGQFVFGAKALDSDIGLNSQIVYDLTGRDAFAFQIDSKTGVIRSAKELKDKDRVYLLEIQAHDRGKESLSANAEVLIKLWPGQFFPTITTPLIKSFTLAENAPGGRFLTKVEAVSPKGKPAGVIKFAFAGGNVGEALRIDSTSGEVFVVGDVLDFETSPVYDAWIEARDSDNPSLRSVCQLTINVTDSNDNPPVFEQNLFNASIYEEEYPPQRVLTVSALDPDSGENGKVTYKLLDTIENTFSIDQETGEITTEMKLDRERVPSYGLTVLAVDHGRPQLIGTSSVLVTVLDKNDNYPKFTRLFSVNVTENSEPGTFVIRVTSSDRDIGENANATYSFTENPGERFGIDPLSGNVTVIAPLDREQQEEYILKVEAFDGSWRAETPLTITIQDQNDNAPEFEQSYYSFIFPELQRSVVFVGQVLAVDRDKQGPNSVISYSLKHPSDLFTIDPATGELFSKRSLRYKYNTQPHSPENQYMLTILATDNGKPPMSSECLVTVNVVDANNSPPKFGKKKYSGPVPQSATIGTKILQVSATDETDYGINAEVEYTIIGGNGSDWFKIDKKSGWISLWRSLESKPLLSRYLLKLQVTDKGSPPLSDEATAVLVVSGENSHAPGFSVASSQVIIPENDPIGSVILTLNAVDNDDGPNGEIEYLISSGNEEAKFEVDPKSGALSILKPLDYDTVKEYHLNITAADKGFEPKSSTAMITIALTDANDNPPVFNRSYYKAYIPENSPLKTKVFQVEAHDIDSPKNAIIYYSILRGSGKDLFSVDSKTGEIFSEAKLDYEQQNEYTLEILATNTDSPMFGSTMITVFVTGVNEFYPRFVRPVFHFDVSESSEVGSIIGEVQATDADGGEDGKVYYLFVGSSNDKGFAIGLDSGVITVARRLDRETQNRVVLTVLAKNFGGIRGNDTDEAQVIVTIQDGNDPPEFAQPMYEAAILESVRPGTNVLTVRAIDTDVRPQNNEFSYSIISGNVEKAFKIDPQTGEIETALMLDREKLHFYTLTIGAIDLGSPPQTGTTLVKISVQDVNDNGPVLDSQSLSGFVSENEPPNTSVMTLSASDPDLPPNGAPFSYYLVGGKHKKLLHIEKDTGVLKTTKIIDREATPRLEVVVEVEDNGSPRMRSQHLVTITVLDQNDSPSTPRTVEVLVQYIENHPLIGKIADVHPNDADSTGDYQCRITNPSALTNSLKIKHGCELSVENMTPGVRYSLTVSGNDGRHSDVTSKVFVEFAGFSNATIEHSMTIRVENMTASKFLTHFYKSFLELFKQIYGSAHLVHLFSMHETDFGLELSFAVRDGKGYAGKHQVLERLLQKREILDKMMQSQIILGYSPCQKVRCENGGLCSDGIQITDETRITDSQNVIFTSPVVSLDFTCRCPEGFTGKRCDLKFDPCLPNPCQSGGACRRQGYDFVCSCPANREGKVCEMERGDACDGNPCRNGGSCRQSPDGSSFFCLCRPGYRGNHCETAADSCRPNPCLHGGQCISLKPGYRCNCADGRYGPYCEKSTFGFGELSYMSFPPLDVSTNDISIIFATTKANALLVYNYGTQTGGRSDFVSVELLEGKAVFSYGGARTAITSVSVPRGNATLADGSWHKIIATRNGRVMSLSVGDCSENGDICRDCSTGDGNCFADDIGPAGTLNFNNQPLLLGGLSTADPVLERPGQIRSDDFVGCLHSVSINGRPLNLSNPLRSRNVSPTCGRTGSICSQVEDQHEGPCGLGNQCFDRWQTYQCICGSLMSADCSGSLESFSFSEGGFVEFQISEKHRRMQLLESLYHGSTQWSFSRERRATEKRFSTGASAVKSIGLMFRTVRKNGMLFYASTNRDYTSLEIVDGHLVYGSRMAASGQVVNMTINELLVSDGGWHNLTLSSHHRSLGIYFDGQRVGDELDAAGVHDFLDPYLTSLFLAGVRKEAYFAREEKPAGFEGCLANFTINSEIQPLNGSGSILPQTQITGRVLRGCTATLIGLNATTAPDPLSIGVTLVIVFFVTLLVAILVSFVVFHLRRQKKEKGGVPVAVGRTGATLVTGSTGADGGTRGLHGEANVGFLSETNDVIRNHHLVAPPELLSKKFKELHPRPDIIEREVVSKSPPLPPIQDDLPEHYDLENASSIAPSDIDIVYHYKGYRDGSNPLRKYKATPPHLPSPYHPKPTTQHRHTAPVLPPPTRTAVPQANTKCTPLARLSPSSELSSQQPRILTLSDISGKPLQSALLATTSSSGGVGKDVLHSNSERSLNSPVMSQLSGQSSSASRKNVGGKAGEESGGGVGLTTEEVERFNNSSLLSTLDAVSSSSEVRRQNTINIADHHSSTSTDESGNDSFTCSEIEYDNNSIRSGGVGGSGGGSGGKQTPASPAHSNLHPASKKSPTVGMASASYDASFDSSFRGSLSTLVASDDDLSTHIGGLLYRSQNGGSPSTAALGWDYLLNWGPNFESLVGVFKDIAELPDAVNGRVPTLRLPTNSPKPSEEYV